MLDIAVRMDFLAGSFDPDDPETKVAAQLTKQAEKENLHSSYGLKIHDQGLGFEGLRLTLFIDGEDFGRTGISEIASVYLYDDNQVRHLRDALSACLALRQTDRDGAAMKR